jgi:hypothetical protein
LSEAFVKVVRSLCLLLNPQVNKAASPGKFFQVWDGKKRKKRGRERGGGKGERMNEK